MVPAAPTAWQTDVVPMPSTCEAPGAGAAEVTVAQPATATMVSTTSVAFMNTCYHAGPSNRAAGET
jgi:hypothetical protein